MSGNEKNLDRMLDRAVEEIRGDLPSPEQERVIGDRVWQQVSRELTRVAADDAVTPSGSVSPAARRSTMRARSGAAGRGRSSPQPSTAGPGRWAGASPRPPRSSSRWSVCT
jgi:hypothetical protein